MADFAAFDMAEAIGEYDITIPATYRGWVDVPVEATVPEDARFLQIALPPTPDVDWPIMVTHRMPGGRSYRDTAVPNQFYAVRTDPPSVPASDPPNFDARNINNNSKVRRNVTFELSLYCFDYRQLNVLTEI